MVMGELSILVVYYNLCYGDYNWWWKSFIIGASPVIYFVIYSIIYFFYLRISTIAAMVIYFGMMAMISGMVILVCGAISVFFCLGFLNKIYFQLILNLNMKMIMEFSVSKIRNLKRKTKQMKKKNSNMKNRIKLNYV